MNCLIQSETKKQANSEMTWGKLGPCCSQVDQSRHLGNPALDQGGAGHGVAASDGSEGSCRSGGMVGPCPVICHLSPRPPGLPDRLLPYSAD